MCGRNSSLPMSASQYDAIRLTVLNRTEGVVDKTLLRFEDVWGKKDRSRAIQTSAAASYPTCGMIMESVDWYVYHPSCRGL